MGISQRNGWPGQARPRVLFVEDKKRFFTRMDRNYRRKYERIRKVFESDSFTTTDLGAIDSNLDPSLYGILLVGVFAVFPLRNDPLEWIVPSAWFQKINPCCVMAEDLWP